LPHIQYRLSASWDSLVTGSMVDKGLLLVCEPRPRSAARRWIRLCPATPSIPRCRAVSCRGVYFGRDPFLPTIMLKCTFLASFEKRKSKCPSFSLIYSITFRAQECSVRAIKIKMVCNKRHVNNSRRSLHSERLETEQIDLANVPIPGSFPLPLFPSKSNVEASEITCLPSWLVVEERLLQLRGRRRLVWPGSFARRG
jgi:hypothetical protein